MVAISGIWTSNPAPLPVADGAGSIASRWEQWIAAGKSHPDPAIGGFVEEARDDRLSVALLEAVFGFSPYLSHILLNDIPFARTLLRDGPDFVMEHQLEIIASASRPGSEAKRTELMATLRVAKRRFAAAGALADITGCRDVMHIAAMLSRFACACLGAASASLLREAHDKGKLKLPDRDVPANGSGLIILGMGKLAASELNFSSDIDLIVLFDEERAAVEFGAHQQVFSRFARNLVEVMGRITEDGYVFRTDLRLRPDPASTPPAVSVRAALSYYRTTAQTWERAAMIKARPVAGDMEAGAAFLEANSGFIWRRSLDFASVRDIRAIKRQINAEKGGHTIEVEGHNVKLGPGGIREIEFLVQTQQLIWGSQTPELRGNRTLETLQQLASLGRIEQQAAVELTDAYKLLRRVEHRLQMVDDQQTHTLPSTPEGVDKITAFLGFSDRQSFRDELVTTLETVKRHYDEVVEPRPAHSTSFSIDFKQAEGRDAALAILSSQGFGNPGTAWETVHGWTSGAALATRSERASAVIQEIIPHLLSAFAATSDPDATIARFDGFLSRVARSIGLLEMLAAKPELCDLIGEIMSAAPRLSGWLSKDPELMEGVLQSEFADLELPDDLGLEDHAVEAARRGLVRVHYQLEYSPGDLADELSGRLEDSGDELQTILDIQRRWARRRTFQIAVHMLRGYLSAAEASAPLCAIAEACLVTLVPVVKREFAARHGTVEDGRMAIIACGKLGSREMTVASDLDLIFVYDHPPESVGSDGNKPLSPTQYYARFCRRFLNGVTAQTAEGRLYEVDMRLRPSGKSGPIACSMDRFVKYQAEDAWTWEHQALTRARVVYAEGDLGKRIEDAIGSVLCRKRSEEQLADDIRSMRERIQTEFGEAGEGKIKYRRGGILDLEFIAQHLQLAHASGHPEILLRDAASVFAKAGELELIKPLVAEELCDSIQFWRNLQGLMLLATEDGQPEQEVGQVLESSFGTGSHGALYASFVESVGETAARVSRHYEMILG